jgi:hypothetical protein
LSIDSGAVDTAADGAYRIGWSVVDTGRHALTAWAFDRWGLRSDPVRLDVRVTSCRPELRILADTAVIAGEASVLCVESTPACGARLRFFWSFDGGHSFTDTTLDSRLNKTWQLRDTGEVEAVVEAETDAGIRALGASAAVRVSVGAPVVRLLRDTTVTVNDTVVLTAEVLDSSWGIEGLLWYVDNGTPRSSQQRQLRLSWGADQTGAHVVRVRARDGRGILSNIDSVRVLVVLDAPRVSRLRDTTVSAGDAVALDGVVGAKVTNDD